MISATLTIKNETGLHTRPGTKFVRLAKTFACNIIIKKGERAFNAKSLLTLLKCGVSQGDCFELVCDGIDENVALESLQNFITSLQE
jgi:phosphocarrier protein HPr